MLHRRTAVMILCASLAAGASTDVRAQERDGYCDYAHGVADSESALLRSPNLFGSFGYVDQLSVTASPASTGDNLRLTFGVGYRLSGLYQSSIVRAHATAQCRRHRALSAIDSSSTRRALQAKAAVLDDALVKADQMLEQVSLDVSHRRTTRQELISTRLRVDRLHELAAETRRQLDALPATKGDAGLARSLASYLTADGEVERQEGRLRRARAWDVSLRMGYDRFLANDTSSPFFAVVSASFNVGWLFQGSAETRAASGRRRILRDERGGIGADATAARMRSLLQIDSKRSEETAALVGDLDDQLHELRRVGGENSRRLAQTVWFEWVEAKAQHEYYAAHVATLRQVLGEAEGQ